MLLKKSFLRRLLLRLLSLRRRESVYICMQRNETKYNLLVKYIYEIVIKSNFFLFLLCRNLSKVWT